MFAEEHQVSQSYLGAMLCAYSVSMAAMCPVVGKNQNRLGRRNMARYGMLIVGLPFLGFYLLEYVSNSVLFIVIFIFMRILQGVGTSMFQTSTYAMVTLAYPRNVNFVVGCIETSSGLGLGLGPFIGTIFYQLYGAPMMFITFFTLCTTIGIFIKSFIPESVDNSKTRSVKVKNNKLSYSRLLSNKRILFANLCVFLVNFHFTFLDPLIGHYLHKNFDLGYEVSGYFFLMLGLGYTLSCGFVHIPLKYLSNMRMSIAASLLLGLCTMAYGLSGKMQLEASVVTLAVAMFFGGYLDSHLYIPQMNEMIEVGKQTVSFINNLACSSMTTKAKTN